MLDDAREEIEVEFEQLRQSLRMHQALLYQCQTLAPDPIELSALGAMLHTFYTGIENVFARITVLIEGSKPHGEAWHRSLLEAMATASSRRGPVLSREFVGELKEYLTFRHLFRHAYLFDLQWEKMRPLVLRCEEVLARFEAEVNAFLSRLGEDSPPT